MHAPQIILLALVALDVGIKVGKHGHPRPHYNGPLAILDFLLLLAILCWGGFFK